MPAMTNQRVSFPSSLWSALRQQWRVQAKQGEQPAKASLLASGRLM